MTLLLQSDYSVFTFDPFKVEMYNKISSFHNIPTQNSTNYLQASKMHIELPYQSLCPYLVTFPYLNMDQI